MSDEYNPEKTVSKSFSDNSQKTTGNPEQDYEKLVAKSRDEYITDSNISRADITNPNLHYGITEEPEKLEAAPIKRKADETKPREHSEKEAAETTPQAEREKSPEYETYRSENKSELNPVPENKERIEDPAAAPVSKTPEEPEAPPAPEGDGPLLLSSEDTSPKAEQILETPSAGTGGEIAYDPDLLATVNSADENAAAGTVVASLGMQDAAGTSYRYAITDSKGNPVSDPYFEIAGSEIIVKDGAPIDYESATAHNFFVTGYDSRGNSVTEPLRVDFKDVNEFSVSSISDSNPASSSVAENSATGTPVGITAFASDADGTTNHVTYSLSNDAGGLFTIDPETGEVSVAGPLDYESAASHLIQVTATSEDGSTSTRSFTIDIADEDEFDVSAISDTDTAADTVAENSAVGTSVGITAFASDADGTDNVTYSLSNDAGGLFAIDPETGVVTVNGPLDYETATSHLIEVTATSDDGSTASKIYSISVGDEDEFDVSEISDSDTAAENVAENSAIGSTVGITAFATDGDGTDNVTYSLSNDAGGLFAINAATGEVTVAGALDYETATSHLIEVTATSDDGSTSTKTFTIAVGDQDEFDVSAISDSDAATNEVDEDASIGQAVGITALASDADGSNNTVTYSLSDDAGGLFTIDANTGVVRVAGALDAETATSHNITVVATSSDGSTSNETFTIAVNDVNETSISAISDTDGTANEVTEGATVGTAVGITALATDADVTDTVTYSLSSNPGGFFAIDANTGVVTVNSALDYESAAAHTIEITATSSDGSTSTETFTIDVLDEDEFDVSAISDTDTAADTVAENSAIGTSVGITAFASDADGTDNVTYSLSNDADGLFAINAATGEVTVAGALDYETATSHLIEVTATSDDGSTSTKTFTIAVGDQDEFDVSAISDSDAATNEVDEDASIGQAVGITALASDADGSNNTVTYSLSDDAGGLFTIDANTGVVRVAGALDAETATSHNITVVATSSDGSTSNETFTIAVNDVNETSITAISDTDGTANEVTEGATVGTAVGITALATDADVTDTVTYSLSSNPGGFFAIDANTGVVTVNSALDYESAAAHTIEITATSSDGSTSTETFTIDVLDEDEFDVSAISDTDTAADTVAENSAIGTSVGITALASDADGSNNTVTYSLSDNAGGLFSIDANTGVVRVAGALDAETATSHNITVVATSSDGSTSNETFTIAVNDVNETSISAISDSDGTANEVTEGATVGTAVGITALATDADVTDTVTYSLSSNPGGFFAIDANTGVVTVNSALDYESDAAHTIEITATSSDGTTSTETFTIDVLDEDEFDVSAISDTDTAADTVAENSAIGTSVGITAFASDADGTDNVTYSLSNDAGGLFAINAATGEVTVAGALDYETATSHLIEVTATSDDGSTSTKTFTIAVGDQDEFDVSAISDSDAATNEVNEDASIGQAVGITALASDADGSNNTVTYSLSDDAGGLFTIDANTGVVRVAGALDAETATSHNITVVATSSDGSTSNETFTIAVNDVNETSISAISDTDGSANEVTEGATVGTAVGITALATDADVTDTVTYSLSSNPGGFFAIDANTGVVTVNSALDYESAAAHTIEITATSSDGSTSTETFTIDVLDEDEFDVSAISDTDTAADTVAENSAVGTSVGITAFASDADGTDNVTYSLSNDAGGLFTIDPTTGEVTVAGPLDYESATSHLIEVTATSDDGSTSTKTFTIAVGDQDEFDVSAISDSDAATNEVDEDASIGQAVGITALATDADGSNNTVTYSLSDDAGGLFTIDANTGVVRVAGALDAETATSHNITVVATSSDGSTSNETFTIAVNDVNETSISAISDTDGSANEVTEGATVGTAVGITALATDADVTDTVTYSLSSNPGGFFAIDANTGVVTVNSALDYESAAAHTIEITATSSDGSTSTETFTIDVLDEDEFDVSAISDTDTAADTVAENSAVGTSVGITAFASDADGTDNVTYSLSNDADGLFAINAATGEVTVAGPLDYESATSHLIEVTATSDDGSTSTKTFNIAVGDQDEFDVSPISDSDAAANEVDEDASIGQAVGITALASDADGSNNTVTYSLSDDAGGLFTIDANTGVVRVAGALDAETATSHNITVVATSSDGSTSNETFTIAVNDVNETSISAISDTDGTANEVTEGATVGTAVGITALATDADVTDTVTYSLSSNPGGFFAIDANTGVVTVNSALDYESAAAHTIEITATSSDGSTSTRSFTIDIADEDEFDVSAISDTDTAADTVAENSAVGTSVGITAFASDADGTDNVTYSLSNDAGGLFAIDPETGVVTVNGPLDYETATSHLVEVTATSDDGSTSTKTFTIAVGDQDEFDVSAISDSDAAANEVDEDASIGQAVGITALASDADGSNNTVTYSLSDDAGGLFTIDANTGVVRVAGALDAETATSHNITVVATSSDGSTSNETFTIAVNDVNETSISAISDTDGTANEVTEGATVGTAVGITALATDADVTDTVTYSLSSNPGGFFAIDANTGVVIVNSALDYESAAAHTIEITATSSDGSTSTETFTIDVLDEDEFDVSAISDTDTAADTVAENSAIGTSVGITAFASDADGTDNVTYSLSNDAGGLFAINAATGEVTVAGALDYETATSHLIEVTATSDDGSTSTKTFNIAVGDQDEFDVSPISDSDAATNEVDEDASIGQAVGITALASDADGSNNTVTYSLSDDAGGLFTIDSNTGVVRVAGALDAETATSHNITVVATSSDGSTSNETFTIAVNDVNETSISAISDSDGTANEVSEGATVGTAVGITALATDADVTDTVTYSLSSNPGGFFAIDANTGVVTVNSALDYESAAAHTIEITATSSDGSTSTRSFTIDIADEDEFDVSAISDTDTAADTVAENSAIGTSVGITAFASDADGTDNVTYSLSNDAGGLFAINAATGEVTVAGALDYETATSHLIEVTATSDDGSTSTKTFTIAVGDQDEFDVSAISDSDAAANEVDEDASIGQAVGITALASDADGSNNTVTYSLSDDAGGLFTIDSNTGVVRVAGALDAETATSHNITVVATSSDGSTSNETFTIAVNDVNETSISAISDTDGSANEVTEGATVGTAVGITALVTDADVTDTVTYSLSSNPGGFFAIDANTGVVTVNSALDYESAAAHTIEITAKSSDGSTSTETFTIDVLDEDEFDVSAISDTDTAADTVAENSAIGTSVGITAFASDADGTDNVTYSLSNDAGGLFTIDPTTGEVTVAGPLDYESATSHLIEVTATSDDGSTSTKTFNIAVGDENEAANAEDVDLGSTNEDNSFTITEDALLANSTDPDAGSNLNVTSLTLNDDAHGTLVDNGDGTWTFTPTDDFSANDVSFDFTISDGEFTDSATATLDVIADADAPDLTLSGTNRDYLSSSSTTESGFEGGEIDTSRTGSQFVGSIGGWQTDSEAIEVKIEKLPDGSTNQYIELNDDRVDYYDDATNIYQNIDTVDGATYTIDFNFAGRPGYDSSVNRIEVLVDGVVVETISADGTGDSSIDWQSHSFTFTGDGTPMKVEFREAGVDQDYGRGMYLDNITINEDLPEGYATGSENTAIALPEITAGLNDQDGSETLALSISNIPVGATITDGTNSFTATTGNTEVDITGWQLDGISLTPAAEYSGTIELSVNATATDGADTETTSSTITVTVLDDDETFTGTRGDDIHDGESGDDTLNGGSGNDWLYGNEGDDTLNGGNGDDTLIGGAGDDKIDGGRGADTVEFSGNLADYDVVQHPDGHYIISDLRDGSPDGTDTVYNVEAFRFADQTVTVGDMTPTREYDPDQYRDDYTGVDNTQDHSSSSSGLNIFGSALNDLIIGGSGDDYIDAGAGDDDANGMGGNDTISGGAGNDVIMGGNGDDIMSGDEGNDSIDGGRGNDTAVYSGNRADYTVYRNDDGSFTIIDDRPGSPDGTDTVINVEFFQFADVTLTETELPIEDADSNANSVDENVAVGTSVGFTAFATDTATYSLSDDAGGLFAIDSETGEVTVAGSIDYETASSHIIEVTSTDSNGVESVRSFTINVNDIAEGVPTDITFEQNSGIALNNDGGNNAKLSVADAGDIVGGLTEMTLEVQFSSTADMSTSGDYMNLFSYHSGGGSDEIELSLQNNNGELRLQLEIGEQTVYPTGITADQILDGGDHQVSVTWDNTSGEWAVYVDGAVIDSGTGLATGHAITAGGMIVLGQEQDSLDGGYANNQEFIGIYQDVRIFDDVRTAQEIADNVHVEIDSTEQGLVADWRMDGIENGEVIDAVSGKNLTLGEVTGDGWVSSNAKQVATVEENATAGTVITTLSTIDPDNGDSFKYAITNDPSGHFEIVGNEIRVKAGADIDYEKANAHDITVEVTDSAGNTYSEVISINVANLEEYQENTADNDARGVEGSQTNWGTAENDTSYGGSGDDTLGGNDGNDTLYGGSGNDQLHGNAGDDELHAGSGNDTVYGHDGNDTIYGDAGDDRLYGDAGNDEIHGGSGADVIYGGTGDDILRGGTGNDEIYGEAGADLFIFAEGDGADTIHGGSGGGWTDTIQLLDANGGNDIGEYGTDWTLTLTSGSIDSVNADSIDLSDDADGFITLQDGSSIDFAEIERIEW